VVDVNPFLIELLGVSREVFLGKKVWELGAFKDIVANQTNFTKLLEKEYIRYEDMALKTADGRLIDVEFVSNAYLVNHQKVIQCNIRDITARKREAEEASRMVTVVRDSNDAITIQNFAGRITAWNRGAELMYGYGEAKALQMNIERLTAPGKVEEQKDFTRRLVAGEAITSLETQRVTKDGRILDVWMTVTKLVDHAGKPIGIASTERDITALKKAEEGLRKFNAELEQRIEERTQEVVRAKEEAEAANRAKSTFLAKMSHELRTPLNAIIGFSEVLLERYYGELNEKQAEYAKDILESGKHLLSLINDILDLSKIEAGRTELELTSFNLGEFVNSAGTLVREKCQAHHIRLTVQIDDSLSALEVTADERRLKQVLFNLLSNAAKFTPDGGAITVEARRAGEEAVISVADTGIGIAPADQERVFKPFSQLNGGKKFAAGTGLGLSISKEIVLMHGGRIWVESEGEGKGCLFSFVIPLRAKWRGAADNWLMKEASVKASLERAINLSTRHRRRFTLARFHSPDPAFGKSLMRVRETFRSSKRNYDLLATDPDGRDSLVLLETNLDGATVLCERVRKKLEAELGLKASYGLATFPDDGKTAEALLGKLAGLGNAAESNQEKGESE